MKAGIIFANSGRFSNPELFAQLARDCEQLGFESIWTVEHVVIPQPHMPYPGSRDGQMPGGDEVPIPDPLLPLAYAAAITSRIKLSTGVIILPQRHPLYLAKQLATLDVLSKGRMMVGIGSGWMKEEFEAVGVPFTRRGARYGRTTWQASTASNSLFKMSRVFPNRCRRTASRFMLAGIRRPPRGAPAGTATVSFRPLPIRPVGRIASRWCAKQRSRPAAIPRRSSFPR